MAKRRALALNEPTARGNDEESGVFRLSTKRGFLYVAIAGVLHVPLFLFVRPSAPRALSVDAMVPIELDFPPDLTPRSPAVDRAESTRAQSSPRPTLRNAGASGAVAMREVGASRNSIPGGELAPEPAPEGSASVDSEPWTFDPMKPQDVTSHAFLARALRDATPPGPEAETPRGASTTGGLIETLDAHDRALGLGRGGPVLTALENAAATDAAPLDGAATFAVTVDTSGHVSVSVLDASSDMGSWLKVAGAAGAALDPTHLRIPPGAHGLRVVARVEAKVQYPNGLDPKKLGVHTEATPGHVTGTRDQLVLDKVPGASVAIVGKVCTVRLSIDLSLTPISGGCDPSNAGTVPLRVVHGRILGEERL